MKAYKWFRGLLKATALTTVMFIMQCCYGTPKDWMPFNIRGCVSDKTSGQPLPGIRLDVFDSVGYYDHLVGYTDENGYFEFELYQMGSVSSLSIEVRDDDEHYQPFDTLVMSDSDLRSLKIKLESNQ